MERNEAEEQKHGKETEIKVSLKCNPTLWKRERRGDALMEKKKREHARHERS